MTADRAVPPSAPTRDDVPTLLAAGVLAYVAETLLHEAGGHGGVCLAQGGRVLMIAPLWMRCSATSTLLVAAGPAMNVLAACGFFAVLRQWRTPRPALGLQLWLGFCFNALIACGYLGVGAASGFGDWPVVFAGIAPAAFWRPPALLLAILGYYGCLRVAAWLFGTLAGGGPQAAGDLRRRALWPAAGAAIVACLAEIVGGRAGIMPLALAVGCTMVVGLSLTSMDSVVSRSRARPRAAGVIPFAPSIVAIGLLTASAFVVLLGPGLAFR